MYITYNNVFFLFQNEISHDADLDSGSAVSGQMLESFQDIAEGPAPDTVYLGIDKNLANFKDKDVDFRYISDAIPKKPFYPASLSK